MRHGAGDARRDVLHERAAERHVHDLQAAADGQDRQVRLDGLPHERDFVLVAAGLRRLVSRVRRLPEEPGIHVAAARQHEGADLPDHACRVVVHGVEHPKFRAGAVQRRLVVGRVRGRCDPDERHGHILGGTSIPISSRARVTCALKYATPAARHRRTSTRSSFRIGARW